MAGIHALRDRVDVVAHGSLVAESKDEASQSFGFSGENHRLDIIDQCKVVTEVQTR